MSAASVPPRRFLHLWFDRLPTDRIRRRLAGTVSEARPLATAAKQANALRLQAVGSLAETLGLHHGLTVRDAHAQVPELLVKPADPEGDQALLKRLAKAARRYSPAVALDPPDSLVLEIGASARLFGGERKLMADAVDRLSGFGGEPRLSIRPGLADTPHLAWALARFSADPIAPQGKSREVLAKLPVAALRLELETQQVLERLGWKRVAQLMDQPRARLARHLDEALLQRLDEALDDRSAPLIPELEIPPYRAERRLAEPIGLEDQVLSLTRRLAERVAKQLEAKSLGAHRLVLELFRVDGRVKRLSVKAVRLLCDPAAMTRLFSGRLEGLNEGLEADFGFDHLRLTALDVRPLTAKVQSLAETAPPDPDAAFSTFLDSLAARLGPDLVKRAVPVPETVMPEREVRLVPCTGEPPAAIEGPPVRYGATPLRPLRLFDPPQPIEVIAEVPEAPPRQFTWRRLRRNVVRAEGPERIEPEWLRGPKGERMRDYYRVEDDDGRRYWIYREGRFDDETRPRWRLHGLLA